MHGSIKALYCTVEKVNYLLSKLCGNRSKLFWKRSKVLWKRSKFLQKPRVKKLKWSKALDFAVEKVNHFFQKQVLKSQSCMEKVIFLETIVKKS